MAQGGINVAAPPVNGFVKLITCDGVDFKLTHQAAIRSGMIRDFLENLGLSDAERLANMDPLPLLNVKHATMKKIAAWCEKHRECAPWDADKWWENERDAEMLEWERKFIDDLGSPMLCDVFLAADYMEIRCLMDKCAQTIADMVKGKSVEEIRAAWMIDNDFTPAEEAAMRSENPWERVVRQHEELDDLRMDLLGLSGPKPEDDSNVEPVPGPSHDGDAATEH